MYIDCKSDITLTKVGNKWMNEEAEFWKDEDYKWCSKENGQSWQYGYATLKDAVIAYTMSKAACNPNIKTVSSMLLDKDYKQENAWNKHDDKKKSAIKCAVVVRRFTE